MSTNRPKTRFVLISTARSGTTVVMRTLRSHPDVRAHEEIFHRKRTQDDFSADFLANHDIGLRETAPIQFAYDILNHGDGHPCVGFKMWPGQERDTSDAILRDPDVHKIILERKNKLGGFSSQELARKSGVWHSNNGPAEAKEPLKLAFEEQRFRKFVRGQQRNFEQVRQKAEGPCLFFSYSDILNGQIGRIPPFLNLNSADLEIPLAKIHSNNLLDRFIPEDRDQVIAVLEDLGHADWAIET